MKRQPPRNDPPPDIDDRVLPHDLDAEKSVLGAILVNGHALPRAQAILSADDFFRRGHQAIFRAMARLVDEQRQDIDLITLTAELKRAKLLEESGGGAYISALTDGVPRSANIDSYATIVKDTARRRALIQTANQILLRAYSGADTSEQILATADRDLVSLQRGATAGRLIDARDRAAKITARIEHSVSHRGEITGVDTGFASINEQTQGWQRGDLVIIAARPSIGKTTFALNSGDHAASTGKVVALFSLEMRIEQLENRRLAHISQVPLSNIRGGWLHGSDLERLGLAVAELGERPMFIDDRGGQQIAEIRSACRRLRADRGLDLVVVDYIQLMPSPPEMQSEIRSRQLDEVAMRLKTLAYEVDVPVILLSQLTRAGEREGRRPLLSDLRDSGALEQHADMVCFLHRKSHRESGPTEFIIEKARNGPTGVVVLTITRETQTFVDGGEMEPESTSPPEQQALPGEEGPIKEPKRPRGWRRLRRS